MNISQPVFSQISGVEFGFLSAEEIRALSVKRITNPTTFDTLLHPVPGGLYDAALGAYGDNPCTTCHQSKFGCPGHCGHVELPAPVYHATFMDQCLRLLRAKCVYCHRLKMSRVEANRFICKLKLVRHGLLKEAEDLEELQPRKKSAGQNTAGAEEDGEALSESSEEEDAEENDIIERRNKFVRNAIKAAGVNRRKADWSIEKNEAVGEERRAVVKEFLADITKGKKCNNCKGVSPSYRKDRYVKIFQKPLSVKDKAAMVQSGMRAENPLITLMKRQRASTKRKPSGTGLDEGVADLETSTPDEDDEDAEMLDADADTTDGGLVASEAMLATKNKQTSDSKPEYMSAGEVHAALTLLFEQEAEILGLVYGPRSRSRGRAPLSADMFFISHLVVPPNRYRPEARTGNDEVAEASENTLYKNILVACELINQISREIRGIATDTSRRPRGYNDLQNAWINLQDAVNSLIDRDRNPIQGAAGKKNADGVKQKLEKKEGLFRKNMMGKRVNFAARSVISPDPNIETNEIGIPPVFARKLTYPEPVTNHNWYELKEAVVNGPDKWPGAAAIENENGQVINLRTKSYDERMALANQLLAPSNTNMNGARNKKVHRHLNNGDVVIMNRQPTLHKPSMMAHRAKVLPGEKTIRMHYANCNTYNADFDGDEMNMHFPQNEIARAEALQIADTDHQYLSATAGAPLRGLIQDHISMGVQLCNRDTFFTREDYQQLLYACLRPESNHTTTGSLESIPPAILKPQPLWTGKQVITTVLKNIVPRTHEGLTLTSQSQTSADQWGKASEEQTVIFQKGELVCGILDKKQIGPSGGGLVNAVYEAYGHTTAGRLLSVLGRLLTKVLHMRAFSCGVEDLILTPEGDATRRKELQRADAIGLKVAAEYVQLGRTATTSNDSELKGLLEEVLRDDTKQAILDEKMKGEASILSSDITKACLPTGLIKPFPKNQMQAMTGSGAKGSRVNANLISCNLGQQVLEGRRVPIMVSGKTLPCFKPFEPSIRAGGYITDRFLTGIRPQEYFFHAMAGREGLIDTAVKTSRSGYLQRCLIKGMEGLKVEYDTSVRDADGTIIQFLYGEDGLDVTKSKYLTEFKFLAENFFSLYESLNIREEFDKIQSDEAPDWNKQAIKAVKKTGDVAAMDPALSVFSPSRWAGSTSEKFWTAQKKYCDDNKDKLLTNKKKGIEGIIKRKNFEALLDVRYLKSVIEAGEAVGVVAGQSVGEPSTQMTLNTFHLAGHSAKNVTLGIPRLREIVMTASANIATPTMTLHLNPEIDEEEAKKFAKGISRLPLAHVIDKVTVDERVGRGVAYAEAKVYKIRLDFYPAEDCLTEYDVTTADIARAVEQKFIRRLQETVRKELKKKGDEKSLKMAVRSDALPDVGQSAGAVEEVPSRPEGEREGGDDDEDDDGDDDATNTKQKSNRSENVSYAAPDDEEEVIAAHDRRESSPNVDMDDETYGGSPREQNGAAEHTSSDEDEDEDEDEAPKKSRKASAAERLSRIMDKNKDVTSFAFDDAHGTHCTLTLEYSASTAKILMLNLVEQACRDAVIQ